MPVRSSRILSRPFFELYTAYHKLSPFGAEIVILAREAAVARVAAADVSDAGPVFVPFDEHPAKRNAINDPANTHETNSRDFLLDVIERS